MSRSFLKIPRARLVALAVGVGALGSLAAAPAAFAAGAGPKPPAVGTNCQPDGKINGGGSTFQTNAINDAFTYGFQQDVCGPQSSVSNLQSAWGTTDPSIFTFGTTNVQGMAAYNVSLSGTAGTNGSGAGLRRLSCRTDMFAGTDLPYNNTQLGTPGSTTTAGLDGPPGSESGGTAPQYNCDNGTLNTTAVPPPYGPQPDNPSSTTNWPNSLDTAANAMSFPVAGGAVAYAVNLNGMCTTGTPTSINLTQTEFDQIWQGTINQWNDSALTATNSILNTDGCSGPIKRVVRQDNSGTTAITMFTLNGIDKNNLCGTDTGTNWYSIATASNNSGQWPAELSGSSPDCVDSLGNAASPTVVPSTSGSPAVISTLEATNGGIGYAELGLWGTLPAGVSFANIQNSTATAFVSPGNPGAKSNCSLPAAVPTGTTPALAVGLGTPNWTNTGTPSVPGKQDIADTGAGYPACGLTFDLVYANINNETGEAANPQGSGCVITSGTPNGACQTVAGPVAGVTNDQLRTMYSYFTYVFSPLGQNGSTTGYLPVQTLDPLPDSWLSQLTQGYQQNY